MKEFDISSGFLYEEKLGQSFTSNFQVNGTKVRCNNGLESSHHEWTDISDPFKSPAIPCGTSTFLVAIFYFSMEGNDLM